MIGVVSMAQSWLRRRNGVLVGVLLLLTPVVVAVLTLWSPFSFTDRVDRLPAALVNQDQPVTSDGNEVNAGALLADDLIADGQFRWSEVPIEQAQKGLDSGQYAVALIIPPSYSADIASLNSPSPQVAKIRVLTNDAVNVVTPTIIEPAVGDIKRRIDADIQIGFLNAVYQAIDLITTQGTDEIARAEKLVTQATTASTAATDADNQVSLVSGTSSDVASTASGVSSSASGALADAKTTTKLAATTSEDIAGVIQGAATIDDNLSVLEDDLTAAGEVNFAARVANIRDKMQVRVSDRADAALTSSLATETAAGSTVTSTSRTAASAAGMAKQATTVSNQAGKASRLSGETVRLLDEKVLPSAEKISTGLQNINSQLPPVVTSNREDFQRVLLSPVVTSIDRANPVYPIGEGLAAQALPLGLFTGALLSFLLLPALATRLRLAWAKPSSIISAPFLAASALAVSQVALMVLAVFALGVRARSWPMLILFLALSAIMLVAVIQLLRAGLGVPGVFAGAAVMALLLASNAGVLPRQVLSAPFAAIEPLNPLTYVADALRRSIAGGPLTRYLLMDFVVIALTTALALLGTYAVARWRRGIQVSDVAAQVNLV